MNYFYKTLHLLCFTWFQIGLCYSFWRYYLRKNFIIWLVKSIGRIKRSFEFISLWRFKFPQYVYLVPKNLLQYQANFHMPEYAWPQPTLTFLNICPHTKNQQDSSNPSWHLLVQSQKLKHYNKLWNLFHWLKAF